MVTTQNMIGWALEFNHLADSHLICEEKSDSEQFQTHIFTNHEKSWKSKIIQQY